jgi:hypothetical protein
MCRAFLHLVRSSILDRFRDTFVFVLVVSRGILPTIQHPLHSLFAHCLLLLALPPSSEEHSNGMHEVAHDYKNEQ